MTTDNTTILWAFDVLRRYEPAPLVVDPQPAPRHYAANPAADESDYHAAVLRAEMKRNQALREMFEPRVYEDEGYDAREFFESEQCPSDRSFR
jgi:hypothetical protein